MSTEPNDNLADKKLSLEIQLLDEELKAKKRRKGWTERFTDKLGKVQAIIATLGAIIFGFVTIVNPVWKELKNRRDAAKLQFNQQFIAAVDSVVRMPDTADVQMKRILFNLMQYDDQEYVTFFMNELLYQKYANYQTKIVNKVKDALVFRIRTAKLVYTENDAENNRERVVDLIYRRFEKFFSYYLNNPANEELKDPGNEYRLQMDYHFKLLYELKKEQRLFDWERFEGLVNNIYTTTCDLKETDQDVRNFKLWVLCEEPLFSGKKDCNLCAQPN